MSKKALIVWGGWDGHEPEPCAKIVEEMLDKEGFETVVSDKLDVFADAVAMASFDLAVPVWTMGKISGEQRKGLLDASKAGMGVAGFHGGMGDAFREDTDFQWLVGGQFVCHPGGQIEYTVNVTRPADPVMAGILDFKVKSEQYYMHVDPGNEVLATTTFTAEHADWIAGTVMPVVWKRRFGKGRVFYSSLGHVAAEFAIPELREILRRGLLWAAR